ncbi:SWIB/MDM2 domain-containing protein [Candidatus Similichlamydia laticola]|uniref:SWIB (YM74) complex protein n=1 Tax=Candidatus Similichlamydia laticola TaxID=2170265 RepID=A0A369KCF8_9BACT|nr:SWIB/MDM2 domain-containing protein [Candidatus Similichlamydia laticola]RDB31282.1 SWIB (YM74) complex protein [Candidatus Similichlamydia laticola]
MEQSKRHKALMEPVIISDELAAVVGSGPLPRSEITKRLWAYIKKHNLQDPQNKKRIRPDKLLSIVFGTHDPVDMFEMTRLVSKHIKGKK